MSRRNFFSLVIGTAFRSDSGFQEDLSMSLVISAEANDHDNLSTQKKKSSGIILKSAVTVSIFDCVLV